VILNLHKVHASLTQGVGSQRLNFVDWSNPKMAVVQFEEICVVSTKGSVWLGKIVAFLLMNLYIVFKGYCISKRRKEGEQRP
jgi:hypothetical protein